MPRFTRVDGRRMRDIEQSLHTVRHGRTAVLDAVLPQIRELLGVERLAAYGVSDGDARLNLDFMSAAGFDGRPLAREVSEMLGSGTRRWGFYDPCRPEPGQRNRAVLSSELGTLDELKQTRVWRIFERLGLGMQQLRVLVCDGPAMLAFIGVWTDAPIGARERRLMQALTPALQQRLRLEEQLARAPLAFAALEAALELFPGAAFVADARGNVAHANAGGRAALEADPRGWRQRLHDAIKRGGNERLNVTPLVERGAPHHHLVVERPPAESAGPRVAEVTKRCALTPRQAAVLARLVEGDSNKTIAARLYCAERTVEAHVTAILGRVGVRSRSEARGARVETIMMQVRDVGDQASPAVLLLHGAPSDPGHFEAAVQALARDHRVLVPHLPGYGGSAPLPHYTFEGVRTALEALLHARGVREVAVLGHSAGAYHAVALALAGRVRVRHVYMLSGTAGFTGAEEALAGLARMIRESDVPLGPMLVERFLSPGWRQRHPADVAAVAAWERLMPRAVLADELEAAAVAPDLTPRLSELTGRLTVRTGELDPAAPPEALKLLAPQIVPGCGHLLLMEDREATVASIVAAFH